MHHPLYRVSYIVSGISYHIEYRISTDFILYHISLITYNSLFAAVLCISRPGDRLELTSTVFSLTLGLQFITKSALVAGCPGVTRKTFCNDSFGNAA